MDTSTVQDILTKINTKPVVYVLFIITIVISVERYKLITLLRVLFDNDISRFVIFSLFANTVYDNVFISVAIGLFSTLLIRYANSKSYENFCGSCSGNLITK